MPTRPGHTPAESLFGPGQTYAKISHKIRSDDHRTPSLIFPGPGAGIAQAHNLLSRWWYILHYHRSTLLLPFRGEVVAGGGRVEERSEVIYFIEGYTVIYYREHNSHSCIA